jgi:hypothetical protein
MFVERKINPTTHAVELWKAEWENHPGQPARKVLLEKIADEQPLKPDPSHDMTRASAICWAYGRTLGNIAVFSPTVLGSFPTRQGDDATLPCDFVNAGKFRHGKPRWWCRTHQQHWGTKADYESYSQSDVMTCSNHGQVMNYVVAPYELNVADHAEVGVWCSMPAALSTQTGPLAPRAPRIHVHVRAQPGEPKTIDRDFDAIAMLYNQDLGLFTNPGITRVNITPPAAFEFERGLELGREMDCISCSQCGFPHLDLGDFAVRPHRKHFCANCGQDSTWSTRPIVSTPLKLLHGQKPATYVDPDRILNLDEYAGCDYQLWASTPAILWTGNRPQERGIDVHVRDPEKGNRVVDDTYSEVTLDGRKLSRSELIADMMSRTLI